MYCFSVKNVDGSGNFNLYLNNPYTALFGMYYAYIWRQRMERLQRKARINIQSHIFIKNIKAIIWHVQLSYIKKQVVLPKL